VVVLIIIIVTVLFLLISVPRGREQARLVGCQRNLSQIGFALALYDQMQQALPTVGPLAGVDQPSAVRPAGPLPILLNTLRLPDLTELKDPRTPPQGRSGLVLGEVPIPGFVCPGDRNATADRFPAPISYRAATGGGPAGDDGAFAPGRALSLETIEAGDGLSHTAGFSERLAGDGQVNHIQPNNYQVVPDLRRSSGCPADSDPSLWRGDAGSSWVSADYRFTLYNHAQRPEGHPSCVAQDGKTAFMSASSRHVRGVNLLLLDGTVTVLRRSIDQKVWQELARIRPAEIGLPAQ
jgi:hypothetical protein